MTSLGHGVNVRDRRTAAGWIALSTVAWLTTQTALFIWLFSLLGQDNVDPADPPTAAQRALYHQTELSAILSFGLLVAAPLLIAVFAALRGRRVAAVTFGAVTAILALPAGFMLWLTYLDGQRLG